MDYADKSPAPSAVAEVLAAVRMAMNPAQATVVPNTLGWRFKLGIGIFVLAFAIWLLIPLAAAVGVSGTKIAALTGTLFIANKVLLLLVVVVMGKAGFQELKRHMSGYVATFVPDTVNPLRHRIGIVMFCLPLILAFLKPYIDTMWPGLRPNIWQLQLLGDVMLIASFFVLGGNFWGKFRALFVRTARVIDAATP